MPISTDREVIERAMAGDTLAFRELVEKHQGFAFSVSFRFVANSSEAEDITQEAFIRLWKHLPKYRFEIKLTTWLYKIVSNLCLDYLKSRHGRRRRQWSTVDDYDEVPAAFSTDASLLEEEFRANVLKMTEVLTPKQKAVFVLRDLEELPVKEVSEILSMSTNNVKSNLYHARLRMGELIGKYNVIPKPAPL